MERLRGLNERQKKDSNMQSLDLKIKKDDRDAPCIWMQAGVVKQKYCPLNYACPACRYDKMMHRQARENKKQRDAGHTPRGKRGRITFWQDSLRQASASPLHRPCIHSMKQQIDFRPCHQDYECASCEFDQFFTDQFTVHTITQSVDVMNIRGIQLPQGYYLHKGHTWLKIEEEGEVRIGLDDFIHRLLGPMDKISVPLMGQTVRQNRMDIHLERGLHEAGVLSPISGVVTAVNMDLINQPELANAAPYTEGWFLRVHPENLRQELKEMVIGDIAGDLVSKDVEKMMEIVEEYTGPLAADGGEPAADIFGSVPGMDWKRLTQTFLGT